MHGVKAVGFDMDYTLAQYIPETFEQLAYNLTLEKLVTVFGYPPKVADLKFDPHYMVRGLTVDKRRGNVLKMDRHKYVKIAQHGLRTLSRDERKALYDGVEQRESFDGKDFAQIDTLFSLAEAYLFMQLVEMRDGERMQQKQQRRQQQRQEEEEEEEGGENNKHLPEGSSPNDYSHLYRDVRAAVDLCHRDGSLKMAVAEEPSKYIYEDPSLLSLFRMLRDSGRQVFICTNSLWDYTNVVMNFLLYGRVGSDKTLDWLSEFDVVIVGSGKPAFFQSAPRPMFEVDVATGLLANTDDGSPVAQIGLDEPLPALDEYNMRADEGSEASTSSSAGPGEPSAVYQGGHFKHLNRMLNVRSGSQILYVGDHIYGDILRSKKQLGWRTMLIVPELAAEIACWEKNNEIPSELHRLRDLRDSMSDELHRVEFTLKTLEEQAANGSGAEDVSAIGSMDDLEANDETVEDLRVRAWQLRDARDAIRAEHKSRLRVYHESFHPVWGQLLKTGYQNSRMAHQISRFACLYTSHVANMRYYSPERSYRSREDYLPHEGGN